MSLEEKIESYVAAGAAAVGDAGTMVAFRHLRAALEAGEIRAAEPDAAAPTGWRVNAWVKRGILLGFRIGQLEDGGSDLSFVDKNTFPLQRFAAERGIRIVPGGS